MKMHLLLLLSIGILVVHCKENAVDSLPKDDVAIYLKNSEIYRHPLPISGDEEGASISKQTLHYQVSEIVRNKSTNWQAVYFYQPKKNYIGKDYVEIELSIGSDGASPPTKVSDLKFSFIIK